MTRPINRLLSFGIFDHLDDAGAGVASQLVDRLELAELCDQVGFFCYHVAEHHCTPHGLAPSPNIFLAALAQRTINLRIGPLLMLLPFYHPLRAYEEICMLDQISGGRLELGIGRGSSAFESEYYGIEPGGAQALYDETAEILFKLMATNALTHKGPRFTFDDVPVILKPLQRPYPPIWYGATRAQGAVETARRGANMASFGTAAMVRVLTNAYRTHWQEGGRAGDTVPRLGMTRHIVIAPTRDEAIELAEPAYRRWSATFSDVWSRRGLAVPTAFPLDFETACDAGVCLVGTADFVREAILEQAPAAGINYLLCQVAFGDLPSGAAKRTVSLLADQVMPMFADYAAVN